ncbi:MAG: SDR family oxidoreductase [Hyphomicrobiales bacterium]|nr:SDR family oxidoreductase [Hyphomicrobiales bacterium]
MALLAGKVALVTGGRKGLGRAIVDRMAAEGAVGGALDLAEVEADPALPDGFVAVDSDVTDEAALARSVAAVVAQFGRLDIVVANAGLVPPQRDTASVDLDEWDRVMAVNARGVAATLKAVAAPLRQTRGSIVVTASITALTAYPRMMLYTATKHAVYGIVKVAALDLGGDGIRVNAVAPGPILTEALRDRIRARAAQGEKPEADAIAELEAPTALGRLATADEVAKAVLFLSSDLASGISGEILPVDAGLP